MLYFIRHAESCFNYESEQLFQKQKANNVDKNSPEFLSLKFDPRFADCSLTQNGRQQCLKAQIEMRDIHVNLVIVSPMRRTLETCHIIFKDHPSKPKIIVDPQVREIFSSSCDIGTRLTQSIIDFPHFDFSLIKHPESWYIHSIQNTQIRQHLLSQLSKKIQQLSSTTTSTTTSITPPHQLKQVCFSVMLQYLESAYGKINHTSLSDFNGQKERLKKLVGEHGNVAVVSHHDNIFTYTNIKSKNCQILKVLAENL